MRIAWCLVVALGVGVLGASLDVARGDDVTAAADKAEREKWSEHMGDVPFVIGFAKGMKDVEFTGKPPLVFFTADY